MATADGKCYELDREYYQQSRFKNEKRNQNKKTNLLKLGRPPESNVTRGKTINDFARFMKSKEIVTFLFDKLDTIVPTTK